MSERKNITQPSDWWELWTATAKKEGLSLSAWIGQQCNEGLSKAQRSKLSERNPAHRPKKISS